MVTLQLVFPLWEPTFSIFLTTSIPSVTLPNTTCFPSSLQIISINQTCVDAAEQRNIQLNGRFFHSIRTNSDVNPVCRTHHVVFSVQMKNCEPLVFGPAFAIDKIPANAKMLQDRVWLHPPLLLANVAQSFPFSGSFVFFTTWTMSSFIFAVMNVKTRKG